MTPQHEQALNAGAWAANAVAQLDTAVSAFVFALNYRVTQDLAGMAATVDDIKQRFGDTYSAELADISSGINAVLAPRNKQLSRQLAAIAKPAQNVNTRLQTAVLGDMATVA